MRNLSPQTRQKLAIMLKSKESGAGIAPPTASPNLMSPPPVNGLSIPKAPAMPLNNAAMLPQPAALNANKMNQAPRFGALKQRLQR